MRTIEVPAYWPSATPWRGQLSYRPNLEVGGTLCDRDAASRFFREFE